MDEHGGMTEEQEKIVQRLIEANNQKVPFFYEEGVCEESFIPIDDGELRIFHHKPKQPLSKRPILFVPGFGTSPWSWRHFSVPMYEKGEYYFLETREKSSSKINNRRKAKMSIDQTAKDIGQVIKYLGLDKKDFVLFGASYCGGIILHGLAKKYFTALTVALYDPLKSWKKHRKYVYFIAPMPPFILNVFKKIIVKFFLIGFKNETQRQRIYDYIQHADAWKWRKAGIQNFRYDVTHELKQIEEETLVFHGPFDKFHPGEHYLQIAREIPHGRYIYLKTAEEHRELLAGIIALEMGKITAKEQLPDIFMKFEL
ncbi:MAG: alpha/beta hydrolase [Asgard group archaeon]|nr:alpha/beta hydrolase [Asgard group archaeon]